MIGRDNLPDLAPEHLAATDLARPLALATGLTVEDD